MAVLIGAMVCVAMFIALAILVSTASAIEVLPPLLVPDGEDADRQIAGDSHDMREQFVE